MSKPTVSIWKPAIVVVAIAAVAIAIAAGANTFFIRAQGAHRVATSGQPATVNAEQQGRIRASMNALPLGFEANQGQTDQQVKYTARGNGYAVFLTEKETVFALTSGQPSSKVSRGSLGAKSQTQSAETTKSAAIDMRLLGGNPKPQISAGAELPGTINYYTGSNPKNWRTGVKQYASVAYRDVYPGVNMVFHGEQRQLEFDFVVAPGADAKAIGMGFKGADKLVTDESGNLVLTAAAGDVVLHKPVAYQEKNGKRENVVVAFQVKNDQQVGLQLGAYDASRELVVDPSLSYATYLGGAAEDDAYAVAIDGSGQAYVTGQTKSTNFPTVAGAYSGTSKGGFDVFVSKIAANGSSLVYSTYIGGSGDDAGTAIALDGSGNAFVVGGTASSSDFPTHGAFQSTFGGGSLDAFVLELASNGGSLTFSTFLGGSGDDVANGVAVDTAGGVYVAGFTTSTNFPLQGPYQNTLNGISNAFVTKLNSSGSTLAYSTYLGEGGDVATAVAVDSTGNAYVTGATPAPTFPTTTGAFQTTCGTGANCNGGLNDAFVTKFNSTGSNLLYSTFLGGEGSDQGLGIAVDGSGDAYVTGLTQSPLHFPVKLAIQGTFGGGIQDAFVTELNPTGTGLVYSTYLGGSLDDAGSSIAIDGSNNAYVVGQTNSTDFPKAAATQGALKGGRDAFVSQISASGSSLTFSTYLGGSLDENVNASGGTLSPLGGIAVDNAGANIYVVGNTASTDFPATAGAFKTTNQGGTDAFVAKYSTGTSSGTFTVGNGTLSNTSGHAGVSANATITVTSTGGFNSAVQLACSVSPTVTKGPTCSFSNPAGGLVTPPANGTATSTLNLVTTASSAALAHPSNGQHSGILYALVLPVFGLTLLGAGIRPLKARRGKVLALVLFGMVLMSLLLLPACGGGNNGGGGGGGTPTGAYTITVTGTSGATMVTGTPTLTLTIN